MLQYGRPTDNSRYFTYYSSWVIENPIVTYIYTSKNTNTNNKNNSNTTTTIRGGSQPF